MVESRDNFKDVLGDAFRSVLDKGLLSNQEPPIQEIVNYVWSKSKNKDRPKRISIDPKDMQPLLPFISIMEVVYKNGNFNDIKVRLFGTELVNVYGEITGTYVSDYPEESVANRVLEDCKLAVDTKDIVVATTSSPTQDKVFLKLKKVLIPLFDDVTDSNKVSQILGLTLVGK